MPDISRYFDAIDSARIRRAKELSEIKNKLGGDRATDPSGVNSKAAVVLAYANWEGFYNECVHEYVRFLEERGGKIRETDWMLLVGAFDPDFESLRARNHSSDAKRDFVANLKQRLECGFASFDKSTVQARSNLDFQRLSQNFHILNFDISAFQKVRNRLDREVVGWRHSVAHGDSPDLSALDIANHMNFAAELLIIVADSFQNAILERRKATV